MSERGFCHELVGEYIKNATSLQQKEIRTNNFCSRVFNINDKLYEVQHEIMEARDELDLCKREVTEIFVTWEQLCKSLEPIIEKQDVTMKELKELKMKVNIIQNVSDIDHYFRRFERKLSNTNILADSFFPQSILNDEFLEKVTFLNNAIASLNEEIGEASSNVSYDRIQSSQQSQTSSQFILKLCHRYESVKRRVLNSITQCLEYALQELSLKIITLQMGSLKHIESVELNQKNDKNDKEQMGVDERKIEEFGLAQIHYNIFSAASVQFSEFIEVLFLLASEGEVSMSIRTRLKQLLLFWMPKADTEALNAIGRVFQSYFDQRLIILRHFLDPYKYMFDFSNVSIEFQRIILLADSIFTREVSLFESFFALQPNSSQSFHERFQEEYLENMWKIFEMKLTLLVQKLISKLLFKTSLKHHIDMIKLIDNLILENKKPIYLNFCKNLTLELKQKVLSEAYLIINDLDQYLPNNYGHYPEILLTEGICSLYCEPVERVINVLNELYGIFHYREFKSVILNSLSCMLNVLNKYSQNIEKKNGFLNGKMFFLQQLLLLREYLYKLDIFEMEQLDHFHCIEKYLKLSMASNGYRNITDLENITLFEYFFGSCFELINAHIIDETIDPLKKLDKYFNQQLKKLGNYENLSTSIQNFSIYNLENVRKSLQKVQNDFNIYKSFVYTLNLYIPQFSNIQSFILNRFQQTFFDILKSLKIHFKYIYSELNLDNFFVLIDEARQLTEKLSQDSVEDSIQRHPETIIEDDEVNAIHDHKTEKVCLDNQFEGNIEESDIKSVDEEENVEVIQSQVLSTKERTEEEVLDSDQEF
eukprot:TRINITY_DN1536_c0_g1_i1.p1 TRINITY_DN1536_c0_g1~~TRINITY_DN1536_c0_g1_i1.p1  ORF type:complete len:820 (+),score=229.38 TRINITY_DN1536_c0_g1_i1:38-2497(+)